MFKESAFKALQRGVLVHNFDANETLFLERELTQLRQKIYEVVFPPTVGRSFVPKATDIAASAETYAYKVLKPIGAAKLIAYAGGDIPRVDTVADEVVGKVRPIGAAYGWNINEMREAARLGTQLSDVKARAARDFIERAIDHVLAFGSLPDAAGSYPDVGMNGLINNSIVEGLTILGGDYWLGTPLDAALVLADLTKLTSSVFKNSDTQFTANTLLLPLTHYSYIAETPFSTLTGETILSVFQRSHPQITQIAPWHLLNAAGAGGKPRAVAFQKDPMVLEGIIPQEFEVMPPEVKGFEFINNCHARCGGTKIYQPLGVKYMDFDLS